VTREITDQFPKVLDRSGIDPAVVERLRQSIAQGEWMPDAHGNLIRLLVRRVRHRCRYHRWYFDIAGKIFAKPIYRMLMYVVSPTLVMLGAQRR
jgi:hypothetical protein